MKIEDRFISIIEKISVDSKKSILESFLELATLFEDFDLNGSIEHRDLSNELFEILANHEDENIRYGIAKNTNTPSYLLEKLSNDKILSIHINVAKNKNANIETLEALFKKANDFIPTDFYIDKDYSLGIKVNLCKNPKTPQSILIKLHKQYQDFITGKFIFESVWSEVTYLNLAYCLARNLNTPIKILKLLSKNDNDHTCKQVALNPNTTTQILKDLSKHNNSYVRELVAKHPNTSMNILKILSKDKKIDVINSCILNPNISTELIEEIYNTYSGKINLRHLVCSDKTSIELIMKLSKITSVKDNEKYKRYLKLNLFQ